jgi:hypothetical protein
MLPFGVTFPATVPQGSEIPEGLMNKPVLDESFFYDNVVNDSSKKLSSRAHRNKIFKINYN